MSKRILASVLSLVMVLALLPCAALAADANTDVPVLSADGTYYEISTGEQLKEILTTNGIEKESWYQNGIREFHLMNDIEIDTSNFETTYPSLTRTTSSTRIFSGSLNGGGYTITVADAGDGNPSQPLFDYLCGTSSTQASVKNLNVVFNGNVSGATVAASVRYADIEDVKITFKKNIEFKKVEDTNYTLASGMTGVVTASDCTFSNIQVIAEPESSEYGTIGSMNQEDAVSTAYGLAAGLYANPNVASATILTQNVQISVSNIGVYSSFDGSTYAYEPTACAAGAVAEHDQGQSRLNGVTVHVTGSIEAGTTFDGIASALALGLCRMPLAVYNCHVTVDGDIYANYQGVAGDSANAVASGLSYQMDTDYNSEELNVDSVSSSVTVKGDIKSAATNADAYACGVTAVEMGSTPYKDITVNVTGEISAENTVSGGAYAGGFSYMPYWITEANEFDRSDCSVSAAKVSAKAVNGDAIAAGFSVADRVRSKNCSVNVKTIYAETTNQNAEACSYAAGFSLYTSINSSKDTVAFENCSVTADTIQAKGFGSEGESVAAGFACAAMVSGSTKYTIKGSSVKIEEAIGADSQTGLFVAQNGGESLIGNTVTLPKDSANITAVTEENGVSADHVRFTASESDGRSASYPANAWESNNAVIMDGKRYPVSCDHDDGDTYNGTLWILGTPEILSYTVKYEDESGNVSKSDTVAASEAGSYTVSTEVPSKDGYVFAGWTGSNGKTYQAGNTIDLTKALTGENTTLTLTPQWTKLYTVSYDLNGGTGADGVSYEDQAVTEGTEVTLAAAPTRSGYTFTGWSDGEKTYQAGEKLTVTKEMTLTAQWSKDAPAQSKLSYDANSGAGTMSSVTGDVGSTVVVTQNGFTRSGYTFAGWNTQADGNGTAYKAGATFTLTDKDTVLYAQWTKTPNGGDNSNTDNPTSPKTGDSSNLGLWFALLIISGGAGALTIIYGKKKRSVR